MKKTGKTIEDYLNDADEETESANYHEFSGLSTDLFDALRDLVDEKYHLKLAKNISEVIVRKI